MSGNNKDKKKSWLKGRIIIVLILIICSVLGAILYFMQNKKNSETHPGLTIGTSSSVTGALLSIAQDQSFFEKEGININIRYYKTAAMALDDMLEGNINISGTAETPIVYKSFERNDFKIFATLLTTSNDPKIIARIDHNLKKPDDLIGKRIGSTKKGQSAHFFLYLFLLKYGIEYKDLTIIHESPAKLIDMLASGDLDAVSLFEPHASYAAQKLGNKSVVFSEPGIYFKTFTLAAKTLFLEENRDKLKRFLKALIHAEKYAIKYPDKAVDICAKACLMEKKIVKNIFEFSSLEVSLPNELIISLRDQARWAMENYLGRYMEIPDYSEFIYTKLLKSISPESIRMDIDNI